MFETYNDILTVEEVAEALKLGTSHVYKLLRSHVKISNLIKQET